jgi:hypothetical protein
VYLSLPVANPHNLRIVDLDKAVNLKDGEVKFSADFIAVRLSAPSETETEFPRTPLRKVGGSIGTDRGLRADDGQYRSYAEEE